MPRFLTLLTAMILTGCTRAEWNWPVMHWAGGIIVGLAVGYGVAWYFRHHLREERRDDRGQPKR